MSYNVQQRSSQGAKGSTELARRARGFHGLMVYIARKAGVSRPIVSRVLSGNTTSKRVMRIALRELAKAEKEAQERG